MSIRWEKLEYIEPMPAAPISTAPPSRCPTAPSISRRGANVVTPVTVCGHAMRMIAHASWRTERRAGAIVAGSTACAATSFACIALHMAGERGARDRAGTRAAAIAQRAGSTGDGRTRVDRGEML